MKDSIDNAADETVIKLGLCSKQSCATCFEFSGCMYEHYLLASILYIEESQSESQINNETQIQKRA